jgi:hypothetical protein
MTNTTIIDTRVRRPAVVVQPARLPRLKTFVGQAVVGAMLSHFVLFVFASATQTNWESFTSAGLILPAFLFLSLFGGVPAGFIIWACTRSDAKPLHPAYRCVIAFLVLCPAWLYVSRIALKIAADAQLFLLAWLLLPVVIIGLFTHSGLRVGRELVRGGEAVRRITRVLAAVSGVVLRVTVILLFMESVVAFVYLYKTHERQDELIWILLLCGHFTASLFVVFFRGNSAVLTTLSLIALAPLVIVFVKLPGMTETLRYIFIGYFALWAVFLQTRWRQTDDALAFLNEEIHYYLID